MTSNGDKSRIIDMNSGNAVKKKKRLDGTGRLKFFLVCVFAVFAVLLGRVFYVQFIDDESYSNRAYNQWTRDYSVSALRGSILDRDGNVLASSATTMTVVIRPSEILALDTTDEETGLSNGKSKEAASLIADTLSVILDMPRDDIYEYALKENAAELRLKRQISLEQERAVIEADLPGIGFERDEKRYYAQSDFLSQVLGYTNIDGTGQEGLEASYNSYLEGTDGEIVSEYSVYGENIADGISYYRDPVDGCSIVTTISYVIQSFCEQALDDAMAELNAEKIETIVMDPNTGEILAMAKVPDMNNNDLPRSDAELLAKLTRNTMISDSYEPGSTFKIITTAAALEENATNVDEMFNCSGSIVIDGSTIKCWRSYNPHGSESLKLSLRNSCNPVFVTLALRMGTDTFYNYIYDFGFGQKTGIDLYGEALGIVTNEKYITTGDLARIGFGQSIAVTPIQMITAVSAVINGGRLMQPYIVSSVEDSSGNVVESFDPTIVRNVISEETSSEMRELLQFVVDDGVVNARIDGVAVGGKTGTAQKYGEDGAILQNEHIASFVGFLPADDPELIVIVAVDAADTSADTGAQIAAPIAKIIMEQSYAYIRAKDRGSVNEFAVSVPNIVGLDRAQAEEKLSNAGLQLVLQGEEEYISSQTPTKGASVEKGSTVTGNTSSDVSKIMFAVMPDLTGMTRIEAEEALAAKGFDATFSGTGKVYRQSIDGGAQAAVGSTVDIQLR